MFALFFSLYMSMFRGLWFNFSLTEIQNIMKPCLNGIGSFFTSLFNDVNTPMETLGDVLTANVNLYVDGFLRAFPTYMGLVAFVLALITSIGIVVVATKGIKKIFTVFFYGVR